MNLILSHYYIEQFEAHQYFCEMLKFIDIVLRNCYRLEFRNEHTFMVSWTESMDSETFGDNMDVKMA